MKTERIREEVTYYVAENGAKFLSEDLCKKYENNLHVLKKIREAERLRIPNLENVMPLWPDDEANTFRWYRVTDATELNLLKGAYPGSTIFINSYPEVICIECFRDVENMDFPIEVMSTVNVWYLSQIMDEVRGFCQNFGYKILDEDRTKREPREFKIRRINPDEFKLLQPNDIVWVKHDGRENAYVRTEIIKYPVMEKISCKLVVETDLGKFYETEIYVTSAEN